MPLVGKIHAQPDLETPWIKRIVCGGKVSRSSEKSLIDMSKQHIKSHLAQFHVDIGITQRIIAHLHRALVMECHRGRLIGHGRVSGHIITVHSKLYFQSGYAEQQIQIAVHAQVRHRQNMGIGIFLICDRIVPVQDANAQMLVESGAEHLYVRAMLCRQRRFIEIYKICLLYTSDAADEQ